LIGLSSGCPARSSGAELATQFRTDVTVDGDRP
jgi:hypothetical protein